MPESQTVYASPDATLDDLLAIAGQKYALAFEPVNAGGVTLEVLQIANMREILDGMITGGLPENALAALPLWAKIWPASIVLGHMLRHLPKAGQSLLEVGAGCGVTGLVAAALGFERVCITDINDDALLFARINILKNGLEDRARVCRADVRGSDLRERFTIIAGAEILYLEELYKPLIAFLHNHLHPQGHAPAPQVLLATDRRRATAPFLSLAQESFAVGGKQISIQTTDASHRAGEKAEQHMINLHRLAPL